MTHSINRFQHCLKQQAKDVHSVLVIAPVNIMVLFFSLFLFGMAIGLEDSIGNCTFSQDCKGYEYCQLIADASCACNFGQCILTGGLEGELSFRDYECQEYTDCPCKYGGNLIYFSL